MGWLSGWQYRKSHVINQASGAGTNYQVNIIVHYGSGTDSGADVYLNGKCRTDFGDIRFTRSDGATLIDYWMESYVASNYAVFWVEIPDDLSSSSATIYIYYGNPSATTTSNGDATFIFFDDFNDNSINPNKWTATSGIAEQNQRLEVTVDNNGSAWADVQTVPTFNVPFVAEVIGTTGVVDATCWTLHMGEDGIPNSPALGYGFGIKAGAWAYPSANGGAGTWYSPPTPASNTTYRLKEVLTSTNSKAYINGVLCGTKTFTTAITTPIRYGLGASNNLPYYDNFFIRKYADPEPSHGSWGSEETAVITTTLTDTVTTTDYITKSPKIVKTDGITLSDYIYKSVSISKIETLSLADYITIARLYYRILEEILGLSDYIIRKPGIVKTEAISLTDIYSRIFTGYRTFTETLTTTDIILKQPKKYLADTIGLSDIYSRIFTGYRTFTETINLTDYIAYSIAKLLELVDGLNLLDKVFRVAPIQYTPPEISRFLTPKRFKKPDRLEKIY